MIEIESDVLTTKLEPSSQDIVLEVQQVQLTAQQETSGISAEVAGPPGRDGERLYWVSWGDSRYTEAAPLVVDGETTLPCNAARILEQESSAQVSSWWDPVTSTLRPHLPWASFVFRVSFHARGLVAERELSLSLDIGGEQGVIYSERLELTRGAGVAQQVNFGQLLFALSTFVANGGTFFLRSDGPVEIFDITILVNVLVLP